jgi:cobalt-zinc-cadmium efflux system membrane fusion protein
MIVRQFDWLFRSALACAVSLTFGFAAGVQAGDEAGVPLGSCGAPSSYGAVGTACAAGEDDHSDEEALEKGPNGGRLLRDGDLAVEVTIFERGTPPEFRVYAYSKDRAMPVHGVAVAIELHRLGGSIDRFAFAPSGGFLRGDHVVEEPHSFDVVVTLEVAGEEHRWEYESYEGRVTLEPDAVRVAEIGVETAGPALLETTLRVTGRIEPNEDRMAHMIPRFPGVVKEVRKRLGDPVEQGEVLAVIQSNESLELYEIRSQVAGTVIKKHVTPGEFVAEDEDVYVVADLGSVWVDLNVYRQDFQRLKLGQRVRLDAGEGIPPAEGRIDYISPFGAPSTQTMLARDEHTNPYGARRPGLFVTGDVVVEEGEVPVVVKAEALQTFRDWTVVFIRVGNAFEVRPVEIGRRDRGAIEIRSGIEAGQEYATTNSFVLKAELGKAGASHDH